MKRKNVGLLLMALAFFYFVSAIWGGYQEAGVVMATIASVVLVLFIGGVWCLYGTKRKGLGLVLMVLPFLLAVIGIWGGYQMGSEEAGPLGGVVGAMINVVALVILVIGVWCLSKSESATKDA